MASEAPYLSNEPPPLREDARYKAREMLAGFEQRKADILKSARSFTAIERRDQAGDVGDVVVIAGRIGEMLESRRKELNEPYRDAATAVNVAIQEFWAPVATEIERLELLVEGFRVAEKKRARDAQLAQEEERRKLRALNAPKAAPPPEPAPAPDGLAIGRPIRGAYGARVGTAKKIEIKIVDVSKVPLEILESPTVKAAIEKVARDLAKHRDTIAGIEITRGERTQIRGS